MKKTSTVLASLVAIASIALLSCSSDSSNPLAEELNLPQAQALPNGLSAGELTPIKGPNSFLAKKSGMSSMEEEYSSISYSSITKSSPYKMSISNVSYGYSAWSSEVCFDFTSLQAGSTNIAYELSFGSYSNVVGTFAINTLRITCGGYWADFDWYGNLYPVGTYIFGDAGYPYDKANVTCCTKYYGTCIATGYAPLGSGPVPCRFEIGGNSMTNYYY